MLKTKESHCNSPYEQFIWDNDIQCGKLYYKEINEDYVHVLIVFPTLHYVESFFNTTQKDAVKVKKFIEKCLKQKIDSCD
jgi:hypothetical protein